MKEHRNTRIRLLENRSCVNKKNHSLPVRQTENGTSIELGVPCSMVPIFYLDTGDTPSHQGPSPFTSGL